MKQHAFDKKTASEIIAAFDARAEMLVQILHAFMERFAWISEDAIRQLATELNLSRAEVHGVVSYYHDFRTTPPGKHIVKVCAAEACQAMGSRELSAHAERSLGVAMRSSSADVTLEPVYCLGNCALSPAVMVDGKTYGRVSTAHFDAIVAAAKGSE
ncbi:MAG: NAD(P)H-dependent oxidoreductase subunit E [Gammaproteobacteria bacterium]|nr:NAD(P)H-dependent oxidoreductase subunit E [Gammaproteobacteria bacterium]